MRPASKALMRPAWRMDLDPAPLRVWGGIETTEPPLLAHCHADLLAMLIRMLGQRERRYPEMIRRREIDTATAAAEIETFTALVADWQWMVSGEGAPSPLGCWPRMIVAIDGSLSTIADLAREAGGFSKGLADQAHHVLAIRWHLDRWIETRTNAASTHAARALSSKETTDAA
ncbi:hypothetical protein [Novosphingobium humi]|uniref:hypothetical protein n=1 Tax=Novosphingobium humi TaxID=2282397 RepID=UPI0025B052DB|nr:hypothetical protein [Novosphingobium humi]WJS98230.1 hypothetical protein NYQ05_14015 [Novosphingobium humi]